MNNNLPIETPLPAAIIINPDNRFEGLKKFCSSSRGSSLQVIAGSAAGKPDYQAGSLPS
jgi:hypothetical protein